MSEEGNSADTIEVNSDSEETVEDRKLPEISLCRVDPKIYADSDSANDPEIDYFGDVESEYERNLHLKVKVNRIMNHLRIKRRDNENVEDYERKPIPDTFRNVYLFSKSSKSTDKHLSCFGVQSVTNNYSTIDLVYVDTGESADGVVGAVYALSGGHGWRALHRLFDQKFLTEIPLKLASPDGAHCHKVSVVVGRCRAKESVFREEVDLSDLKYGEVCTKFTATVDNKIEIEGEGITRFQKLFAQSQVRGDVKFEVTQGRIVFKVQLTIPEVTRLCKSLEEIFKDTSRKFEIPGSKIERLIIRASEDEEEDLSEEVSTKIAEHINYSLQSAERQNENQVNWDSFDICHKFETDFTSAQCVELKVFNRYEPIGSNPTMRTVMNQILLEATQRNPRTRFTAADILTTTKMSFPRGSKKVYGSLIEYLRGHFYSRKYSRHYWMLNSKWYFVADEFLSHAQKRFQEVLKDHLLPHLIPPSLPLKIKYKYATGVDLIEEDEYNKEYLGEEHYYVGDKITPRSIEYFDLAYDSREEQNTTFLYHVKKGFDHTTRDACSQLVNSLELLENFRKTNENRQIDAAKISTLAQFAFGNNEDLCKQILGLGDGNENRKLKYVLSLQTNPRLTESVDAQNGVELVTHIFDSLELKIAGRSLHLEKFLKRKIPVNYISEYINSLRHSEFKRLLGNINIEVLQQRLITFDYLARLNGEFLQVKPKLFLLEGSLNLLEIFPQDTVNLWSNNMRKNICDRTKLMLSPFITYFNSLGAKLEVIRCWEFARDSNAPKDCFKICEVLVDSNRPTKPKPKKEKDTKTQESAANECEQNAATKPKRNSTKSRKSVHTSPETKLDETTDALSSLQLSPQPSTSKQTSAQLSTASPASKAAVIQECTKSNVPKNEPSVEPKSPTKLSSSDEGKPTKTTGGSNSAESCELVNSESEEIEAPPGNTEEADTQSHSE